MKIKVVSDGTPHGTRVVDAATSEPLDMAYKLELSCEVGEVPTAKVWVWAPIVEIVAEGTIEKTPR